MLLRLRALPTEHLLLSLCRPFSSSSASELLLLLQQCTTPQQIKQIHAHLLSSFSSSSHLPHSSFHSAQLIAAYSRFNLLSDALAVFRSSLPPHTSLLYNSILRASLSHNREHETLSLYIEMKHSDSSPDGFTFPLIIRACSALGNPKHCAAVHSHAVVAGYQSHLHVCNDLVLMYGNLGRMDLALRVFDGMPLRTIVSWNTLISGFSLNRDADGARGVFGRMGGMGCERNSVTWTALLSAHARCGRYSEIVSLFEEMKGCRANAEAVAVVLSAVPYAGGSMALGRGKRIHGYVVRSGFEGYSFVRNSLVCMYGKLGRSEDAEKLFGESEDKDLVSWNALISSYAAAGLCYKAYGAFSLLERTGRIKPDVVSWSAVIGGFALAGMVEQSLGLFRQMQNAGVQSNPVTLATVLSACAEISALQLGREIHCQTVRGLMEDNILMGNGLLNMYSKSGNLQIGRVVFERIKEKDLISWNSMIQGYGMNGQCDAALSIFSDMLRAGFEPDGITFVAILSACGHAGRVSEGRQLFDQMSQECKLSPSMEHYSCMVDLLGRAGLMQEACELIRRMPMEPNVCVWGALLNSCRIHENAAVAEDALMKIAGLEGELTGNYMLVSNIYAASGRWEESASVRVLTKTRGMKKSPGQSWIELKKKVYIFSAGSSLPPGAEEAYGVLEVLNYQMESENCMPEDWLKLSSISKEEPQWISV